MSNRAEAVAGLGLLISSFALGVMFAATGAPVFAALVSTSVTTAAIGWFTLGAVMAVVSIINAK